MAGSGCSTSDRTNGYCYQKEPENKIVYDGLRKVGGVFPRARLLYAEATGNEIQPREAIEQLGVGLEMRG
jgi:hypothetical protein